jgi:phage gp46-like protein
MTDFALTYQNGVVDLVVEDGDLKVDESLLPAVLVSLLVDRRAEPSDPLPDASADRRGWWADAYLDGNDKYGSRLWLLRRAKNTPDVRERARDYAMEALAWLIEDGVAERVDVTATVPEKEKLQLRIAITRKGGTPEEFTVDYDLGVMQ